MGKLDKPTHACVDRFTKVVKGGKLALSGFAGSYEHTLDEKGRVSVPTRVRERLGDDRLVVTTSWLPEWPYLIAYPVEEWNRLMEYVRTRPPFDPETIRLKHLLVADAAECVIDKQGRMGIPPTLRDFAGLTRDVLWVGGFEYVEIWDKTRWAERQKRVREGGVPWSNDSSTSR
jgi:MraZ protein